MATVKKATKKKAKDSAKAWKAGLAKHKKSLIAADGAIQATYKWSEKRIRAIVHGLLAAHYILHSGAVSSYIKNNSWAESNLAQATDALKSARAVFNQALEYYEDEEEDWDEDEEEEGDYGDDD